MISIYSTLERELSNKEFDSLYSIIIAAYAKTEIEVWGKNYVRVSKKAYQSYVDNHQILYAMIDHKIVGGIYFYKLKDNTWTFSLLGSDFEQSGKGIGKALVGFVEALIRQNKGDKVHIEVLKAKDMKVESKIRLHNWYLKMGYDFIKTVDVFEVYNDAKKWSRLKNPSVFDCYLKKI
jgi:GNAT superfamily N-acetyltransferase